jgi:hypothetical protein
MCVRAGVPQYTTLKLGRMETELVYMVGQSFLFLAGVFAFTWSYMTRYIATKHIVNLLVMTVEI